MCNLQKLCEKITLENENIVLFGAGKQGLVWLEFLTWMQVDVLCFCDNDPIKQCTQINGIPVISYEQACHLYPTACYIPSLLNGLPEIIAQLKDDGLYNDLFDLIDINVYSFWIPHFACSEQMIAYFNTCKNAPVHSTTIQYHFDRVITLSYTYISGVYYFASLLDGHSQIMSIPMMTSAKIVQDYTKRWNQLDDIDLALDVFYFCLQNALIMGEGFACIANCFLDQNGNFRKELQVPYDVFSKYLFESLVHLERKTLGGIIKSICGSYARCKNMCFAHDKECVILYHLHACDSNSINDFLELIKTDFNKVNLLITVKNPLIGFARVIQPFSGKGTELGASARKLWNAGEPFEKICSYYLCSSLLSDSCFECDVAFVRFESTKLNTEQVMREVCRFIELPFEPILLETTALGMQNYYKGYRENIVTGAAKASLTYEDTVLNLFDKFRLDLLFFTTKVQLGYAENKEYSFFEYFSDDFLQELYRQPFEFEKHLEGYMFFNAINFHKAILKHIMGLKKQVPIKKLPLTIIG